MCVTNLFLPSFPTYGKSNLGSLAVVERENLRRWRREVRPDWVGHGHHAPSSSPLSPAPPCKPHLHVIICALQHMGQLNISQFSHSSKATGHIHWHPDFRFRTYSGYIRTTSLFELPHTRDSYKRLPYLPQKVSAAFVAATT